MQDGCRLRRGLGNTGAVCGAVIGAVMAIGLKRGRADSMEKMLSSLPHP
ncbi:MAG: C_GCAxxG_C_C family protein [Nitrospira sp.]|nr:C_GCAxxG_C_C family protein [bacterium]MBL7049786.1 C_GCAxxG_C_C family protein [Nitrospira sp.]